MQPTNETPRAPSPLWRVALAIGLLVTAGLLLALWPALSALSGAFVTAIEEHRFLVGLALLSVLAALLAGVVRFVWAWAWRMDASARQARVVRMQNDLPISVDDVRQAFAQLAQTSLAQHYAMKLAEAERQYPNLSSFHQVLKIDSAAPAQIADATTPAQLLPDPLAGLGDAITRGWSTSDRWLVGVAAGAPQQIVLKHTGFIAISGVQGTGKTNAAALLAAQCAVHDGTLFIADPHYGDDESLSSRIRPFSGAVARFAATPEEINAMIAKVDSIFNYRRDHPGVYPPVLLIIDEFMRLMIRKELSPTAIESLLALSGEGRKKRIFCVPIAQNWNLRVLGGLGVSVRQAVTHALVFKSSKETAELLLPSYVTQQAIALKPGKAIYFGADEPAVTDVPWLSAEDMQLAARGRIPTGYTPGGRAITAGLTPPPMPIPPTERVQRPPAPPTEPLTITVQEQITGLLIARPWLTSSEIAHALLVDVDVIRTELNDLLKRRMLTRRQPTRPTNDRYEWAINQSTNPHLVVSA